MKYLFSIFILISFCVKSQKFQDTIIGNPKYVREYVSFLTEKQNPQFLYNSDYGHEGFLGNEFTKKEFKEIWFNYDFVYYINYEKFYKKKNNSLLIKENWFYKDHSFLASFSKEFYNGKLTKLVLDSSAVNRYKTIFINYKNRNPKQIRLMKFSKTKDYNTRKYFFKKNQLKKISRYVNGRKQYDSVFVYDKKNLVEEYVLHKRKWKNIDNNQRCFCEDPVGVKEMIKKNYFDEKNNLIKVENYKLSEDNTNYLNSKVEYKYDDNKLISKQDFWRDWNSALNKTELKKGTKTIYEYKFGKLLKKQSYTDNKSLNMSTTYYYDDNDNISKIEFFDNENCFEVTFRYRFDENNNWIEIIKNVNGKDLYMWKREIEYH
ncbi:hypothetical protein [Cloacibacterium caeni]|uniref:hypothetical protein n=1 Tax=Cloacibacterium caeni TaxID=2004710 RepID=UPI001BCD9886|nr:hypothetical protein [Cloacibacterium caeni]